MDNFCGWAQQRLAQTELLPEVVTQAGYEEFVRSKASTLPFVVQQYWSNPTPGSQAISRVVSCKMKTAERINHEQASPAGVQVAAGDRSCDAVAADLLTEVKAAIPGSELALSVGELVVDPEQVTFIGPLWLRPWPFQPLSRDKAGRLHIQSRALYVPFSWWIPMPDRFKGTYYCHLIGPEFLRGVLRGRIAPGI